MTCNTCWGPSIKYVTLFLANFYPLPLSHFVTHPGTPTPQKYVPHLAPPLQFLVGLVKETRTKFCLNCSRCFLSGGFVRGSFVWGGFCPFLLLSEYMLQQKFKHHFEFHVSYV